jgi:hypothetical protein
MIVPCMPDARGNMHQSIPRIFAFFVFASCAIAQNPARADEQAVGDVVKQFADMRNAHDGNAAAATYLQDGEYIGVEGNRVKGKEALAKLWSGVTGRRRERSRASK